jgi:hypothetical protein
VSHLLESQDLPFRLTNKIFEEIVGESCIVKFFLYAPAIVKSTLIELEIKKQDDNL